VQPRLRLTGAGWRALCGAEDVAARVLEHDTLLFAGATVLAGVNLVVAAGADYRSWALLATPAYALATAASWGIARMRDAAAAERLRGYLTLAMLVATVLAPLAAAVVARSLALPGVHAQAEVAVIEHCGSRFVHGHDCYLTHPTTAGTAVASASLGLDRSAFVPYLPAMGIFGIPSGLGLPAILRDARVWMVAFTLGVLLAAARLARLSPAERTRLLRLVVVLPVGALPMVTGGDDLPVIALLLAGILLVASRPRLAGLALGLALAMKLTAWPVAALLLASHELWRERRRILPGVLGIGLGANAVGLALGPTAFLTNNVRFPLGFTSIRSPAQSPLLGQALVSLFPADHRIVVSALLGVGILSSALLLGAAWPLTVDRAIVLAAAIFVLATVLAPQTRFGYLVYPFDLLVIGTLRRDARRAREEPIVALPALQERGPVRVDAP